MLGIPNNCIEDSNNTAIRSSTVGDKLAWLMLEIERIGEQALEVYPRWSPKWLVVFVVLAITLSLKTAASSPTMHILLLRGINSGSGSV